MINKRFSCLAILLLVLDVPCFAGQTSNPTTNKTDAHAAENKPSLANGETRLEATKLQSKLQSNSESGKINSERLSQFQGQFDELRAKEEELRARGAMTSSATNELMEKMQNLEKEIDNEAKGTGEKHKEE